MRVISRIFCAILAAVVVAISVVAVVEIVLAAFSQSPWLIDTSSWFGTLTGYTWGSSGLRLTFVAALVVGVVLLVVAWAPRPHLTVTAEAGSSDDVALTLRRREVEALISSRLTALDYVTAANASVSADRVDVTAHGTRDDAETTSAVKASVASSVDQVALGDVEQRVRVRKSVSRVS